MTDRIKRLLDILKNFEYMANRKEIGFDITEELIGLSDLRKNALCFVRNMEVENPWFYKKERIGFNRSNSKLFNYKNEVGGENGNITPDYETVINSGLDKIRETVILKMKNCNSENKEFYETVLLTIDAALQYADRCRNAALNSGNKELYDCLCRVPHGRAESFLDACVFLKFIIFTLRCNRSNHIGLGCFDRYMLPFYEREKQNGKTDDEILEIIEEFFISINFDSDLYDGVQKGDNGQSMMLGGKRMDGSSAFTDLTRLCMKASLELNLIDPKINLRVDKNTPNDILVFATELTKQGLGFPQYCNDDIVIPGLIDLGYAPEDAYNYTVAACWEFIIPGKGADIPNLLTFNFPEVVRCVINEKLVLCKCFEDLLSEIKRGIEVQCDTMIASVAGIKQKPSPYRSLFTQNCIESGNDVSQGGAVYNNFGIHGAGIANAADSLAAVREIIYEKKLCSKEKLLEALKNNFEGFEELRKVLFDCPKMGNNDDRADMIGVMLLETFSKYVNGKPNGYGGIYRAGTGSAHEYYYSSRNVGATADGRKYGEPYSCSFSPSLLSNCDGPLSCIQSFTKFDLKKSINGGPLTLEIHDSVFRNSQGIEKVAQMVKAFVILGGHQLQLNSINRERLLKAEEHPEEHKNLIVRVWGWSGHFVELEKPFRDHIIKRTEYKM